MRKFQAEKEKLENEVKDMTKAVQESDKKRKIAEAEAQSRINVKEVSSDLFMPL